MALVDWPLRASFPGFRKGKPKKNLLAAAFCLLGTVSLAQGQSQAPPKSLVAVVRINAVLNNGMFYERVRPLLFDPALRDSLKKINTELNALRQEVIACEDEAKLNELSRRTQFLTQKRSVLQQQAANGNVNADLQALIRKFIVDTYKDKYQIIMQQDAGMPERLFIWKGGVQTDDITDEVEERFRDYLNNSLGE